MPAIERGLVQTSYGYIHYRTAGSGEPIVLMHINQQSSDLYREMMEALAPKFRVVAVDYPSHGSSDHIPVQPSIADYASCVDEVMQALGHARYNVLGEATGAGVAVELSATRKDKVIRCVLVNCPIIDEKPDEVLGEFKTDLRPADETGFPRIRSIDWLLTHDPVHAPFAPDQDWMDRLNRAQIECGRDRWQALTALVHFDMTAAQKEIECPVLLLVGEHFYCRDRADEIVGRIRDCRMFEMTGARFCAGWERAGEIAGRVIAFAAPEPARRSA
jgi:pimeloyl-ACP methyl ester carboxylesterase